MVLRKLSEYIKKQVAFRQAYKCSICLLLLPPSYQIDHIIPHSISFDDTLTNLTALCPNCHANKTQKEYTRILYYKKRYSLIGNKICYFCFEIDNDGKHVCDMICKDIPVKKHRPNEKLDYDFYQFANLPDDIEINLDKLKIENETLYIRINREYIYINNFFTKVIDDILTPNDLGNIVKEVIKDEYKYTDVQVDIFIKNEGGLGGDSCIDYFSEILPNEMPEKIFKKGFNIKYIYFVDDE